MASSSALVQFPPPPGRNKMTVMETDGSLVHVEESNEISYIQNYPKVVVTSDNSGGFSQQRCESAQMAFLSHEQKNLWKRALQSWQRDGMKGLLEDVSCDKDEVPSWFSTFCKGALACLEKCIFLKESLFPQMGLSSQDLLKKYSQICDSGSSPVTAVAWHPHVAKLAVARVGGAVTVHQAMAAVQPTLRHKLQRHVTQLAWQPFSGSVLAVACETCVLIWHVEPTSLAVRPSTSTVQVLAHPRHGPVTCLAWDPFAEHLVTASPANASVLVWDVPSESCTSLKRSRGGGVANLAFSPDGTKLLTATTSPLFRVWETDNWKWEVWSQLSGRVTASCWSPDGSVLLFAMEGESSIFAIRYSHHPGDPAGGCSAGSSILLADLAATSMADADGHQIRVGGNISQLIWDKTGERVAVLFEPSGHNENSYIAIFKSTINPMLELIPSGFVKGKVEETAHHIAFQPSFSNGALLTVVWSSGRLGYVPLVFVPSKKLQAGHPLSPPTSPLTATIRSPYSSPLRA